VWYVIQGPDTAHATTFLDYIKARGHNFTRVWCFFYYNQITYDDLTKYPAQPWPYLRTGPGTALDGAPKFDLTRPNDTYFQSLKDFVHAAQNRGIVCSVMLFGSYNLIRNDEFNNCVWHESNNICAARRGVPRLSAAQRRLHGEPRGGHLLLRMV
jgi:hypothetical protein